MLPDLGDRVELDFYHALFVYLFPKKFDINFFQVSWFRIHDWASWS